MKEMQLKLEWQKYLIKKKETKEINSAKDSFYFKVANTCFFQEYMWFI